MVSYYGHGLPSDRFTITKKKRSPCAQLSITLWKYWGGSGSIAPRIFHLATGWWVVQLRGPTGWTKYTERQVSHRTGGWVDRTACPDAGPDSVSGRTRVNRLFQEVTQNSILCILYICWHNSVDCLNGRVLHLATSRSPLPDLMDIRPCQVNSQGGRTAYRSTTDTWLCNGGCVTIFNVSPKHLFLQRFLKREALSWFYEHFKAPLEVPLLARPVTSYDFTVEIVWEIYYPLVLSLKVIM